MRNPADVAAIRRRLADGYPARSLRLRLAAAKADVATLLGELEWAAQACDGFTEMIGRGLLRPNTTPSGRRRRSSEATTEVFWPGQLTRMCDPCAARARGIGEHMGFTVETRPIPVVVVIVVDEGETTP